MRRAYVPSVRTQCRIGNNIYTRVTVPDVHPVDKFWWRSENYCRSFVISIGDGTRGDERE